MYNNYDSRAGTADPALKSSDFRRPAISSSGTLPPQTQRILRAAATDSKSLSLVTKIAFLAWARAALRIVNPAHKKD